MNEQELNNLINDFNTGVDKQLELEHNINLFADEVAAKLILEIDRQGVLANFGDQHFSFKMLSKKNDWTKLIYEIKLLDLDHYRHCLRFNIPEQVRIKKATFEHEGKYNLKDEIAKVLVLMLFDYYEIPITAEELRDDQ